MNLVYAHWLLVAMDWRSNGGLEVTGRTNCGEVQNMTAAGLLEIASRNNHDTPETIVVKRVTELGRTFLRSFASKPPPELPSVTMPQEKTPIELGPPSVVKQSC